jgi:hypothetical protein
MCNVVLFLPLQPLFPASCYFCTAGRPYSGGDKFLALTTIFLTVLFLRHATVARPVIFLPATDNLFRDSQLAVILPFGFWRRPAARFRSLRRFLSPLTGITAASSLGTS